MDLDELFAALRDEHNIDVPALQKAAADAESLTKLSAEALAESGVIKLSATDGPISTEDFVAAVTQLASDRVELSNKVDALVDGQKKADAESRIDKLVAEGFITPAKREANLNLLLTNPEAFDAILPEKPLVALSAESGLTPLDETPDAVVSDEIARLTAFGESQGLIVKA